VVSHISNNSSSNNMFIEEEIEEILLELDEKSSVPIKKDFLAFYDQSFKYLEKQFDFSDNYLYKI
jgi:hypothetical protein